MALPLLLAALIVLQITISVSVGQAPWDLPVLPSMDIRASLQDKPSIPRSVWIAFPEKPSHNTLRTHHKKMMAKNANWTFHLQGNEEKLHFMEQFFANTSTLWAYKAIHPRIGNSAADIWRYAVLWMFGGLYLDDDSNIGAAFDHIIKPYDTLIVSTEKNVFKDQCYHENFHLSQKALIKHYPNTSHHIRDIVVSWAIFAAPHHPVIYRTLQNIVEVIRYEYLRMSTINLPGNAIKWLNCMCATGPMMFTVSIMEMVLHYGSEIINITLHKRDFHYFGGVFKVHEAGPRNNNHYMHIMREFDIPLLHSYVDTNVSNCENKMYTNNNLSDIACSRYNGKVVTNDGKEIFFVMNGERRTFQDWDSFIALQMLQHHTHKIDQATLIAIQLSKLPPLSSKDFKVVGNFRSKIQNWTLNWPTLDNTFLINLEGKVNTNNITVDGS